MMPEGSTITTDEALRLRHGSAEDRSRLAALTAGDARLAEELAEWDRQDAALRALYAPVAEEPVPERLREPLRAARQTAPSRPTPVLWRIAAALALVALGFVAGWGASRLVPGASPGLAQAAMASYATYAVEVKHPVEVAASDEAHLVQWLSKRLGAPIRPPDLAAEGFTLIGGRLLPGDTAPAALLMYEDTLGRRLALYITRSEGAEQDLAFAEEPGKQAFWWVEGGLGCALAGDLPRETLRKLAVAAYHGLTET
jgi:anti-sigma factor RsiW